MLATLSPSPRGTTLRKGWRHMKLSTAMEQFIADCQDRKLASATIYRYRSDIRLLVSLAMVEASDSVIAFTPKLARSYFRLMSEKDLTLATLHRRRAALSEFAKWGLRQRLWTHDPMAEIPQIKRPKRLPRPFRPEERKPLLELRLETVDRLLRALLYYTGLRVTPLSLIRLGDISDQPIVLSSGLTWPGSIRTIGKGNKEHVVPMHPDLAEIIRDFALSRAKESGLSPRAFLLAQKSGKPWSRRMIEKRTKAWGKMASVEGCTPHRFRHTFVTILLEAGVPLEVVSKLAAHEDISTTMLYAEVADHRKAAAILQMPTIPRQESTGVTGTGSVPGHEEPSRVSEKSPE